MRAVLVGIFLAAAMYAQAPGAVGLPGTPGATGTTGATGPAPSGTGILSNVTSGVPTAQSTKLTGGVFFPTADSTTAIQFNKADGTTNVLTVDTTNSRVGIGTTTPSTALHVIGNITAGDFLIGSGNSLSFTSRALIRSPSDGVIILYNSAAADFTRLQFGGTTSSFPALKRSSTTLAVRLADDSADAPATASTLQTKTILTVATLATCNGAAEGTMSAVNDALAPAFLVTVVGGGMVHTAVYCNGSAWVAN